MLSGLPYSLTDLHFHIEPVVFLLEVKKDFRPFYQIPSAPASVVRKIE